MQRQALLVGLDDRAGLIVCKRREQREPAYADAERPARTDFDRQHFHWVGAGLAVDANGIETAANGEKYGIPGLLA